MVALRTCRWLAAFAALASGGSLNEAIASEACKASLDSFEKPSANFLLQVGKATAALNSTLHASHAKSMARDAMLHGIGKKQASCSELNLQVTPSSKVRQLKNLRWLHIPKAGTSFIATIWNYACGQGDVTIDLAVDAASANGCMACYDFALMDRYPMQKYCKQGVLEETSSGTFLTQHQPLILSDVESKSEDYAGFFRKPSQRLISAYFNGLHASGLDSTTNSGLHSACDGKGPGCYAKYPGIAGCTARMLTGKNCADAGGASNPDSFDGGASLLDKALENIDKMSFVGLTERWDESICLFHRMFGGHMSTAQMVDFHQGTSHNEGYDESQLDGFVDEVDEKIYEKAKKRFEELLSEHVPDGEEPCGNAFAAIQEDDETQKQCSCKAAAAECGAMTESTLDCGECPVKRLTIVSKETSTVTCDSASQQCLIDGESGASTYSGKDLFAWDISS